MIRVSRAHLPFLLFAVALGMRTARAEAPPKLTLTEAVSRARARHPAVVAQSAQVAIAEARIDQARAAFLPVLSGDFAYRPQTPNVPLLPGEAGPSPSSFDVESYWQGGLTLKWTAFDWGRSLHAYHASEAHRGAQSLGLEAQLLQTTLETKLAYFAALAAEARVVVSEEDVATRARHLEIARSLYGVGARTQIDVLSAESESAAADLRLARARGDRGAAVAQLLAAIGDPSWHEYTLVPLEEEAESGAVMTEEDALKEATSKRPEPKSFALEAEFFSELESSIWGGFFPSVFAAAGASIAGPGISELTPNLAFQVGVSYPALGMNPFALSGDLGVARASEQLLTAQKELADNDVRLETSQARSLLIAARQAIESAKKLVATARARRDLAEQRYRAGIGSILELSDAELVFVNARSEEVRAKLEAAQAGARLDKALGRGGSGDRRVTDGR